MKLLLDTHLLIWAGWTPRRISSTARSLIGSPDNDLVVSTASLIGEAINRTSQEESVSSLFD